MTEQEHIEHLKKLGEKAQQMYAQIRDKISDLEELPKAKALVGQCFKYRNGYNAREHWWLYLRVTGHNQTTVYTESFQEDSNGKLEFTFDRFGMVSMFQNSGYLPISQKEYDRQKKKIIRRLERKLFTK